MTDPMTIKGSWIRNQTAKAIRNVRRSCDCQACENEEMEDTPQVRAGINLSACIGLAILLFIGGCWHSNPVHASNLPGKQIYTDEQAVRILIGEAADQGFMGMVCVGEVLRKNGNINEFFGLHAKHVNKEPAWVWAQAKKAWVASKTSNYTKGANHLENIKAFGCPSWVKRCVETFRYKDHIFYKEVRA